MKADYCSEVIVQIIVQHLTRRLLDRKAHNLSGSWTVDSGDEPRLQKRGLELLIGEEIDNEASRPAPMLPHVEVDQKWPRACRNEDKTSRGVV